MYPLTALIVRARNPGIEKCKGESNVIDYDGSVDAVQKGSHFLSEFIVMCFVFNYFSSIVHKLAPFMEILENKFTSSFLIQYLLFQNVIVSNFWKKKIKSERKKILEFFINFSSFVFQGSHAHYPDHTISGFSPN